jgi:Tol biopolymer transport system component
VGFISNQSQRLQMYRRLADGTAAAELVPTNPDRGVNEASWSRDGRWLIFRTNPADVFARGLGADTATVPLLASPFDEINPTLSPDGRWLAYASTESGRIEVFVRPFPNTQSGKWQVSAAGGVSRTGPQRAGAVLRVAG